ncbi:LLM class flavin-dependent oxidoreductase, partial [Streptomyces sp. NPDC058953]|uniref:LLM class flavin-dependent oxidoreductase n=1 Tax=Streptomyces sp. NPDC058953 TaxID=3346676 RepID=UPI0036814634
MTFTVVRFNLVAPGASPDALAARYRTALEMAAYADGHGVATVQTEEHHGAANNWLPSPFVFAGAVLGATRRIGVTVSAAVGPLYDPLRLAEDIAVLDLLGRGRLTTVVGIGYRPEEYERSGVPWPERGRRQDELLETLLAAWTGEPFTYRGRTVRVTPRPYTRPHPLLLVGGSSRAAARRAARLGLPFFPSAHLPELAAHYDELRTGYGTGGWTMMPGPVTPLLHVSEDPDRAWAAYGEHFLHEARTYASWQSAGVRSAVRSRAGTVG